VNPKEKFLNSDNLYLLLDWEPYLILLSLIVLAWGFYRLFLSDVSEDRHKAIRGHLRALYRNFAILTTFFVTYWILLQASDDSALVRAIPYIGLAALLAGMIVFVKACRLVILQYLFLGSMRHGVPLLIVNIFSLILSLVLSFWIATRLFSIEVAPLLATSAAFSVVLGLALQDTLGNLFAGISLQVDSAFDIDDWLEVTNGATKTTGQVREITWRSTMLVGWMDETIIFPNRILANSQIANFSQRGHPIIRSHIFRLPFGTDLELARQCLLASLQGIHGICDWPAPFFLVAETTESWISVKLGYYINQFGSQYSIASEVTERALQALKAQNIELAPTRIIVENSASGSVAQK
jgi:small-conductance mechanosensitive channel